MKKFLFFLFLLTFIACPPSNEKREEFKKRRKEHGRQMAECILKHENISPEFKKLIEENKDENIFKALHPKDHKLDKNDRDIIRNCGKEMHEKMKEEWKREREARNMNNHNDNL